MQVIEMLWKVAYSDGILDPHEDMLLRQIAGLIHVSDQERGSARKRALDRLSATKPSDLVDDRRIASARTARPTAARVNSRQAVTHRVKRRPACQAPCCRNDAKQKGLPDGREGQEPERGDCRRIGSDWRTTP